MSDPSPGPRQTRSEATRLRQQVILDAALTVFTTKGLEQATIADIRTTAQVSIGSLYHHFSSKEDIVDALCLKAATEWQDAIVNALTRQTDPRRGVDRAVSAHFHYLNSEPQIMALLLRRPVPTETLALDHFRSNYEVLTTALAEWIDRHAAEGELRPISPDLCAAIIVGPLLEHARNHLMGRATTPQALASKALSERIWAALANPAA